MYLEAHGALPVLIAARPHSFRAIEARISKSQCIFCQMQKMEKVSCLMFLELLYYLHITKYKTLCISAYKKRGALFAAPGTFLFELPYSSVHYRPRELK